MAETEMKTDNLLQEQRRSLYVGDLHPEVNAIDLYNVFSKVTDIAGVRVCYDCLGHSLCYGYVNYFFPLDAAKAMSVLNHTNMKGKPMRIMWCERNPFPRKTGKANLFVKNLDSSVDSARLDSIFSKFGTVVSCKVEVDEKGNNKGYGYVQFEQEESAVEALNSLHDTLLEGKKLFVSHFMRSSQRNQNFTNLYVKNLKRDVTDDDLKKKFSDFGKVKNAAVMRDDHGISKGYGFVDFESPDNAKKAMEALNGTSDHLGCGSLFVGRAQKKAEREKMMKERIAKSTSSTVYVTVLDPYVTAHMLRSQFSVCGKVVQAKVMRYSNGVSGMVTFSSPSEAKIAAAKFGGRILPFKSLFDAKAQSKEGETVPPTCVTQYFSAGFRDAAAAAAGNIAPSSLVKSLNSNFLRQNFRPYCAYSQGGQNFIKNEGLNLNIAAQDEKRKLFPKKTIQSNCSSSTAINITSCTNLRMVVPEAE
ncbi:hypothetical protein BVRB_9g211960 isoform B [Beta vulgaris subsp. vulgaris]|nr:polyadenylate-binding protein 2 isoform X2 [Beta vulgaris subsp. vulgaris]KMT01746.1 hypothetical protein BVRB_9g211960 isoform B [Beta vulgaris subsp. vulgaris]